MKLNKLYTIFAGCLIACGGLDPADFVDQTVGDAGSTIGQTEQAISAKFGTFVSYGPSNASDGTRCTIASGAGGSNKCMIPSITALLWKTVGAEDSSGWKLTAQSAFPRLIYALNVFGCSTQPCSKFTQSDVTGSAFPAAITFQKGTCPGDAVTATNVNTFVCVTWPSGTNLTESLNGTYAKWSSGMVVNVDLDKVREHVSYYGGDSQDEHELIEHGLDAAAGLAAGIGRVALVTASQRTWMVKEPRCPSGNAKCNGVGEWDFDGFQPGDVCRARSFALNGNTTVFTQSTGTCSDN